MARWLAGRLLESAVTLWLVATVTFALLQLLPGGPFSGDVRLTPALQERLEARYGLDRPLPEQYLTYLQGLARGDLGVSMHNVRRNVGDLLRDGWPASLLVGGQGLLLGTAAGLAGGMWAGAHAGGPADRLLYLLSWIGLVLPGFLMASLLQYLFAVQQPWFPVAGWEDWSFSILPSLALAGLAAPWIFRLVRANTQALLRSDFVLALRAHGLGNRRILFGHLLPHVLLALLGVFPPMAAALLTGTVAVEAIFGVPGIGRYFLSAVLDRDYPLAMGVTLLFAVLLLFLQMLADGAARWMDPRLGEAAGSPVRGRGAAFGPGGGP